MTKNQLTKLLVDVLDEETASKLLRDSPTATPKLLAEALNVDYDDTYDCVIIRPTVWHAADQSGTEIEYDTDDALKAAEKYVEDGDWGDNSKTTWVDVYVWRIGLDAEGKLVKIDRQSPTITIDATEPKCDDSEGHDWQSPIEIVGGIKENPGVWGHGGGVIIKSVCMRCGCERCTDTWATNFANGEQGLNSVSYEAGKYRSDVDKLRSAIIQAISGAQS